MDLFSHLFGSPQDLLKKVITHTTASAAKPLLVQFFNGHMNAADRARLADHLTAAGDALRQGHVADAADDLSQVIGEIKL